MSELRFKVAPVWKGDYDENVVYDISDEVSFTSDMVEEITKDTPTFGHYRSLIKSNTFPLNTTSAWSLILDLSKIENVTKEGEELNKTLKDNEAVRVGNEITRVLLENVRNTSEQQRVTNENNRKSAEISRKDAETNRTTSENSRKENETTRINAENQRKSAENTRISNEEIRISNENTRQNNEISRNNNEQQRMTAENTRISNENTRQNNEQTRQLQEGSSTDNPNPTGSRWARYKLAESDRNTIFNDSLLNRTNTFNLSEKNRTQIFNSAEFVRQENENTRQSQEEIRQQLEGSPIDTASATGSRWARYKQAESDRTSSFNQTQNTRQDSYNQAEGTPSDTASATGSRWARFKKAEETRDALVDEKVGDITRLQEEKADTEALENGDIVPAYAEDLAPWADQKALVEDTYTDEVRTSGGDIPLMTSYGVKPKSIVPVPTKKWTADMLFNGSYNMLNAAKFGSESNQPYVGGIDSDFVYFLVPELTLGTFGTADENNGLLFTDEDGIDSSNWENQPIVYFKPLYEGIPTSSNLGTVIAPQGEVYNQNTYSIYTTPGGDGAGWFVITFPQGKSINNVCAHIAWEDWYNKYVAVDEPETNPEAQVGALVLSSFLNLVTTDGYLRGVNKEVNDHIVFEATKAIGYPMVDETSVAANAWTNATTGETDSQGNTLYKHSTTISAMKQGGAACIQDGVELNVNGNTVSYVDTNATVASACIVFYQIPTTTTVEKSYGDTIFSDSTVDFETGTMPINDCSIETQVGADGEAYITNEYAKNIADQVAINATVDVPQIKEQVEEHEERIVELEDTAVRTGSYDASVAVGLADNFKGDTVVNAEFYKRKTGGTQNVGSGIAAIKEVRGKSIVWNQLLQQGKLVDMGLPSGTLWATCNIDVMQPDGFAASPFQYECSFFSWGNIDGHNPISSSAFDYDWGNENSEEPWYEGQPYGETQGNTLTGNIPVGDTYDAARVNVGSLWRMPTRNEYVELFNNIIYINADGTEVDTTKTDKRVIVNGIRGLYIKSKINGVRLFFACSGYGNGTSRNNRGSGGFYWSSTFDSSRSVRHLYFYGGGVNPQSGSSRCGGFPIRPVINKSIIDDGKGGHKYAQYNDNISDLTLMFGSGNEPNSAADVVKMFPLDYYDYNAGTIIPFAGQNLVATGKNQYNPTSGKANLLGGQQYQISGTYTKIYPTVNLVDYTYGSPVISNTYYVNDGNHYVSNINVAAYDNTKTYVLGSYCINNDTIYKSNVAIETAEEFDSTKWDVVADVATMISEGIFTLWDITPDANGLFTLTKDTEVTVVGGNDEDTFVGFYDGEDNTFEPYIKHTLPLDPSQWRDKNGNLVFPYGGMHGVGSVYDYAKVDADGYIRKAVRCFGQVDLGTLNYGYSEYLGIFSFKTNTDKLPRPIKKALCTKYTSQQGLSWTIDKTLYYGHNIRNIVIVDSAYNNATTFKAAMQGVPLVYELEEPVEVELATPVYAKYLVDKDGTEEISPANGSTPYTTMANLSILYAMDARGEIKNLPKNYFSKESAENMLNAMVSAGVIASYTMTYDATSGRYAFVIVKEVEPEPTPEPDSNEQTNEP